MHRSIFHSLQKSVLIPEALILLEILDTSKVLRASRFRKMTSTNQRHFWDLLQILFGLLGLIAFLIREGKSADDSPFRRVLKSRRDYGPPRKQTSSFDDDSRNDLLYDVTHFLQP